MTETYCGHCMLNIRWDEVAGWWVHWIDDDPTFSKHRCSEKFAQVATPVEQVEAETEAARVRPGWQLIRAERMRQRVEEGRTLEHDDEHDDQSLTAAAIAYAEVGRKMARAPRAHRELVAYYERRNLPEDDQLIEYRDDPLSAHFGRDSDGRVRAPSIVTWPWEREAWKPSEDPIRNLVKAGALIAAEIDRLQRLK